MITRVAIKIDEQLFVGDKGDRHETLYKVHGEDTFVGYCVEGFTDENGKFYNREEAAEHAFECGQVPEKWDEIYSEDLW